MQTTTTIKAYAYPVKIKDHRSSATVHFEGLEVVSYGQS